MEKTLGNIHRSSQPVEMQYNQDAGTSSTNTPTNYIGSRSESDSPKKLTEFEIEISDNQTRPQELSYHRLQNLPTLVISQILDNLQTKDILNLINAFPDMKTTLYEVAWYIDVEYIETLMTKYRHIMLKDIIPGCGYNIAPLSMFSVDNLIIDCSCRPMGYKFTTVNPFSEDYKGKIRVHIDGNTLTINKVIDGDITSFKDTMMHRPRSYIVMNNGNTIIFQYEYPDSQNNFYCVYYTKDSRLEKLFIDYPNKDEFKFYVINNIYPYEIDNKELIVLIKRDRFVIQNIVFENDVPKVVTLLDIDQSSKIFMGLENMYFSLMCSLTSNDGKVLIQNFHSPINPYADSYNPCADRHHALILELEGDVYLTPKKIMYDIRRCDISFSGVYITTLYKENKELWIYDLQNDNKQLLSKNVKTYVMNHDENMIIFITIDEEETETLHLYNYNKALELWKEDNNISKKLDDASKYINYKSISITNGNDSLIIKGVIKEKDVKKRAFQVLSLNNIETEARNIVMLYEESAEQHYYPHSAITVNGLMFVTNYSPGEIKIYTYNKHRTKLNIRATISLDTAISEQLNYLDPYGRFIQLSNKRIIKLDKLGTREV